MMTGQVAPPWGGPWPEYGCRFHECQRKKNPWCQAAFSAARVAALVDGFEAVAVDMGVDFGGGDVRVP